MTPTSEDAAPPSVLVFNASDPTGAGGVTGDVLSIASVGGHALPVVTGAYVRDTTRIFDFFALEEEAVTEQARTILEDAGAGHQGRFCRKP
jgi:hydroxymethylpyrimidine/phosphomethylpyrimidine kinase